MKKLLLLVLAFGLITFNVAALQYPPPQPPQQQPASQEETARGRVTAMTDTSLTIELDGPKEEGAPAKTMDFVKDSSTKTEGTLENGVTVTVTYKKVDGQNVATRINVEKKNE